MRKKLLLLFFILIFGINQSYAEDIALNERLLEAASTGNIEAVKNLVSLGADVNCTGTEGLTALHYAVISESPALVRFLVQNKAIVNARDPEGGYTPLHYVCRKNFRMMKNRLEMAVILIAAGADLTAVDDSGATALHMAATGGLEELSRLLIDYGADVNARTGYHQLMPLHQAAAGGFTGIVRLLLDRGADVNAKSAVGWTALHSAKNRETAEILLGAGAEVNAVSNKGFTPLSEAVSKGDVELVKLLVEKGADLQQRLTGTKRTLLHYAGNAATAEYLVSLGIQFNVKDTWGYTPLHTAVDYGYKDVVKYLIMKGADLNAKITWFIRSDDFPIGSTPLDIALDTEPESEIAKFLEAIGAKTGRYLPGRLYYEDLGINEIELFRAVRNGHLTSLMKRIRSGANVNCYDNAGWTPLHWSAYFGRETTTEVLIANGSKINALSTKGISRDYTEGQTPLDIAEAAGKEAVVKILLSKGAKRGSQLKTGSK